MNGIKQRGRENLEEKNLYINIHIKYDCKMLYHKCLHEYMLVKSLRQ